MSYDGPTTPVDGADNDRPERSLIDALASDARVHKGFVMDDVKRDAERDSIRKKFREHRRAGTITVKMAADAIGENKSTVSQVVSGKYPTRGRGQDKVDAVLKKLDQWMAQRDSVASAPKVPNFAWTRFAEDFRGTAFFTVRLRTMGVVTASSGNGKSITAQAMLSEFPGSILLTIDDRSDTLTSFSSTLAKALKLDASYSRAINRDNCVEKLRDTGRLIMIDEAHLCDMRLLNSVRQLYDATKCPILLIGEHRLAKKIEEARCDGYIGAMLYSRVGIKVDLEERCRGNGSPGEPLHSVEDVRKVFARSKLRLSSDSWEWVAGLANTPEAGGLRAAQNVMRMVEYVVERDGDRSRVVSVEMLLQATRNLVGLERSRHVAQRVKQRRKAQ